MTDTSKPGQGADARGAGEGASESSKGTRSRNVWVWIVLVCEADLTTTQKAVCFVLLRWADHATGRGVYASVGNIGRCAGLRPRQARKVLGDLDRLGAIKFVRRSRGGWSASGRPHTHEIALSREGLGALARAGTSDDDPGDGVPGEPGDSASTSRHPATGKTASEQPEVQPNEQPT
jgi:hypothetical protein